MRRLFTVSLVLSTLHTPPIAFADPPRQAAPLPSLGAVGIELEPPPRWPMREITLAEATVSGLVSAGILTAALLPPALLGSSGTAARWQGGLLFDDGVRRGLMLDAVGARETAADYSDAFLIGLFAAPVLDAVLSAWIANGDLELAGRLMLIDLQAHALAQGLTALFKHTVLRERPMTRGCREDPQRAMDDPRCGGDHHAEPASFFSGHTSAAFTSAALICLHHTELGLLGREGAAAMCATGMALASTVGVLRILADRHYATDVIVGAGVGVLSGWLVPWLLHYDVADPVSGTSMTVAPMVDGDRLGAQVFGRF
jgi:membrane-associated phospholipid phosphatase